MSKNWHCLIWVGIVCATSLFACSTPDPQPSKTPGQENQLTLNNFSVEQSDPKGKLWWRLKAKEAVYTLDQKVAQVTDLDGELYQDERIVMKLTAKKAAVEQDGKRVLLRGNVTAQETRNSLVVVCQELEWQPAEDLLTIRNNIQATHPQLRATGKLGKYVSRRQRLDLFDNIVAFAPTENIRLQTSHLQWQVDKQIVVGDQPVQIERYRQQQSIEQVNANQISYNLDKQTVRLQDRVKFNSLAQNVRITANSILWNINRQFLELQGKIQFTAVQPPLQISADRARWQIQQQVVTAQQNLRIVHQQQQATFTANSGEINLKKNVATLQGNAQGIATRNQAKLNADRLVWQIDDQKIIGNGNVRYQQQNPALVLSGSTGVGRLQDQTVVVTGKGQQLVETQIVPTEVPISP